MDTVTNIFPGAVLYALVIRELLTDFGSVYGGQVRSILQKKVGTNS